MQNFLLTFQSTIFFVVLFGLNKMQKGTLGNNYEYTYKDPINIQKN